MLTQALLSGPTIFSKNSMFPVLSCNIFGGKAWKISLVMSVKNEFDNKMFGHFDTIIFNKPKIQNVSVKFIFTLTFLSDIPFVTYGS